MAHETARKCYTWNLSCGCSAFDENSWATIQPQGDVRVGPRGPLHYAWKPGSSIVIAFAEGFPRRQRQVVTAAARTWQAAIGQELVPGTRGLAIEVRDGPVTVVDSLALGSDIDFLAAYQTLRPGHDPKMVRNRASRGVEALVHKKEGRAKPANDPTSPWPNMVFGIDLCTPWGFATALHEVGHALGLGHQHQRKEVREPDVIANRGRISRHFATQEKWPPEAVEANIVKVDDFYMASKPGVPWDPYSIMHYAFPCYAIASRGLFEIGTPRNYGLSRGDRKLIHKLYHPEPLGCD